MVREMYCEEVCNSVTRSWDSGMSGLEKRERVRYGLVGAAESVIGYESRREPDLFKDNTSVLKELRTCSCRWLKSGSNGDSQKCVSQRKLVAGAVKQAKNDVL